MTIPTISIKMWPFNFADLRGFVFKNGKYEIHLKNGMRLEATSDEVGELRAILKEKKEVEALQCS